MFRNKHEHKHIQANWMETMLFKQKSALDNLKKCILFVSQSTQ